MSTDTLVGKTFVLAEDDLFLASVITKKLELLGAKVISNYTL